jgi:hypothetical protein
MGGCRYYKLYLQHHALLTTIWVWEFNFSVKTSWAKQSWIQCVSSIGGHDYFHIDSLLDKNEIRGGRGVDNTFIEMKCEWEQGSKGCFKKEEKYAEKNMSTLPDRNHPFDSTTQAKYVELRDLLQSVHRNAL